MSRQSAVPARIVAATAALLASRGQSGTGLEDIITRSAAPRGSLYHYFPGGKAALVGAALDFVGAGVAEVLERAARKPPHARNQLQALGGILRQWLQDSDFSQSCPLFVTAVSLGPEQAQVRDASRRALDDWRALFEKALRQDACPAADARALACLLVAALEGALGLARLERSLHPLELVQTQLLALLPA